MNRPWLKFYPSDWLGDEALSRSSLAAQGLWMRLLAVMHQNTATYGHMPETPDGEAVEVARMAGCSKAEAEALIADLERRNVFSRDDLGRIYSRRMEWDNDLASKRADAGRSGGRASFAQAKSKQVVKQTPKQSVGSGLWDLDSSSSGSGEGVRGSGKTKHRPTGWAEVLALPEFDSLRASPRWMEAWSDWIEHASTRGTKANVPGPSQAKRLFRDAIKVGTAHHSAAIDASIRSNWQGINPAYIPADDPSVKANVQAETDGERKRETLRRAIENRERALAKMDPTTQEGRIAIQEFRLQGQTDEQVIASVRAQVERARAV